MARFRPKGLGLERVLGTRQLAAVAYGDVGSSIYYGLGLVAIFALGLTPVVYVVAGVIFVPLGPASVATTVEGRATR